MPHELGAAKETIFALSSGRLPSAVAVTRVSGPLARSVVETVTDSIPKPRRLAYRALRDHNGAVFDHAMAVFLPGPGTATGEDCAEFHLHGGRPVFAALSEALSSLGCRQAEPGEFTKRAFLNGKLDLVQAEAVADVVAAETEAQRRFASSALAGTASGLYAEWRARLLHARAMIEAELDFADESDVPGSAASEVWGDMGRLAEAIEAHAGRFAQAEILRDGFEVVILGAPNAGKSSLLNALAAREVAIVSDEAGTTRDLLEVQLDLGGLKVRVVDTAGLHERASGEVERIGMERARRRAESAHLVVLLADVSAVAPPVDLPPALSRIAIGNKADLVSADVANGYDLLISARTGEGVSQLLAMLRERAEAAAGSQGEIMPSRERHVGHLHAAALHLRAALLGEAPLELRAEELRLAGSALGRITGEIGTEEVLGAIFSQFCIGK